MSKEDFEKFSSGEGTFGSPVIRYNFDALENIVTDIQNVGSLLEEAAGSIKAISITEEAGGNHHTYLTKRRLTYGTDIGDDREIQSHLSIIHAAVKGEQAATETIARNLNTVIQTMKECESNILRTLAEEEAQEVLQHFRFQNLGAASVTEVYTDDKKEALDTRIADIMTSTDEIASWRYLMYFQFIMDYYHIKPDPKWYESFDSFFTMGWKTLGTTWVKSLSLESSIKNDRMRRLRQIDEIRKFCVIDNMETKREIEGRLLSDGDVKEFLDIASKEGSLIIQDLDTKTTNIVLTKLAALNTKATNYEIYFDEQYLDKEKCYILANGYINSGDEYLQKLGNALLDCANGNYDAMREIVESNLWGSTLSDTAFGLGKIAVPLTKNPKVISTSLAFQLLDLETNINEKTDSVWDMAYYYDATVSANKSYVEAFNQYKNEPTYDHYKNYISSAITYLEVEIEGESCFKSYYEANNSSMSKQQLKEMGIKVSRSSKTNSNFFEKARDKAILDAVDKAKEVQDYASISETRIKDLKKARDELYSQYRSLDPDLFQHS